MLRDSCVAPTALGPLSPSGLYPVPGPPCWWPRPRRMLTAVMRPPFPSTSAPSCVFLPLTLSLFWGSCSSSGEDPLAGDQNDHDMDSIAGVLKLHFRGLEHPLFPKDIFHDLMACVSKYPSCLRLASGPEHLVASDIRHEGCIYLITHRTLHFPWRLFFPHQLPGDVPFSPSPQ